MYKAKRVMSSRPAKVRCCSCLARRPPDWPRREPGGRWRRRERWRAERRAGFNAKRAKQRSGCRLLLDLVVDGLGGVGLLGGEQPAEPAQRLVADDEGGGDGGLAVGDDAALLRLLDLGGVDFEDVVAALETLVEGEEDQATGVAVELAGGLLDGGEALVEAVERLVADGVGSLDVGRDVLVGPGEPGQDGAGKGLVGRIAEFDGALAEVVGLDDVDAVADEGVVGQMLGPNGCQSARGEGGEARRAGQGQTRRERGRTWMTAEL